MQCFICGEPMRVVMVEPHHLIAMPGFQVRTFQCVGCGDVEKRPFFDGELARCQTTTSKVTAECSDDRLHLVQCATEAERQKRDLADRDDRTAKFEKQAVLALPAATSFT